MRSNKRAETDICPFVMQARCPGTGTHGLEKGEERGLTIFEKGIVTQTLQGDAVDRYGEGWVTEPGSDSTTHKSL